MSNADLAKTVHLTPTPCLRRVRAMENHGLIMGYRAVVDRRKIGFAMRAFIGISRDRDVESPRVWHSLELLPEIVGCYLVCGEFDILLDVVCENSDALSNVLIERLLAIPGVRQTRTLLVLREIKSDGVLPVEALR